MRVIVFLSRHVTYGTKHLGINSCKKHPDLSVSKPRFCNNSKEISISTSNKYRILGNSYKFIIINSNITQLQDIQDECARIIQCWLATIMELTQLIEKFSFESFTLKWKPVKISFQNIIIQTYESKKGFRIYKQYTWKSTA